MASNKTLVPGAKDALNRFKMEATNVGVSLKQGYNGDLTSKQAGPVRGQMVNGICPVRHATFTRSNWKNPGQIQRITYEYALAI